MGKPFRQDLDLVKATIRWAAKQQIADIRSYLFSNIAQPAVFVGSGGSYSACHFATMLHRDHCAMAVATTPLLLMSGNMQLTCRNKICYLSASGGNKDILNSYSALAKQPDVQLYNVCMKQDNKLRTRGEELFGEDYRGWNESMPSGKDGFLAVNSLVAYFVLLARVYGSQLDLSQILATDYDSDNYTYQSPVALEDITHFTVLYGKYGEAVAYDIESKLSEAALGDVQLADYRNFGHGRHHWFDKRLAGSAILALVTPSDRSLAEKTLSMMPAEVPVIYINSELPGTLASIDLLIRSFQFVADLGKCRGIDPGKPGVPDYGSWLYNLNYISLLPKLQTDQTTRYLAIARKCGVGHIWQADSQLAEYYDRQLTAFLSRLTTTRFTTIAFDYDGTLSGTSHKARYDDSLNKQLCKAIAKLLAAKVEVIVVTGRGKSVIPNLRDGLPSQYHAQVKVGPYNGLEFIPLSQLVEQNGYCASDSKIDIPNDNIEQMYKLLTPYKTGNCEIENKSYLLQITKIDNVQRMYELCCSLIAKHGFTSLSVIRSTHSIDVVYSELSNKAKVQSLFPDKTTLCIGDCGAFGGNDFTMLALPYSLSVDSVSQDGDSCWNLIPDERKDAEATLYYLKHITIKNGTFTIKFDEV